MFPPFFLALEDPAVAEPWLGEELDVFVVFGACFNPDGLLPLGDPLLKNPSQSSPLCQRGASSVGHPDASISGIHNAAGEEIHS